MVENLVGITGNYTSSLDAPERTKFWLPAPDEFRSTSMFGEDYPLPWDTEDAADAEDADEEARSWANLARRARGRWAKENPL